MTVAVVRGGMDMAVVDRATMARVDRVAIGAFGITLGMMMENAGRAVAAAIRRSGTDPARVTVVVGPGNNGGGGLASVRHLLVAGLDVQIVSAGGPAPGTEPTAYLRAARALGVAVHDVLDPSARSAVRGADLLVDAILGYNAQGPLRGDVAAAAAMAGDAGIPILSLDLPTGLDADLGTVVAGTICAQTTVTLALPKQGLLAPQAAPFVGRLFVATLGLPKTAFERAGVTGRLPAFDADGLLALPSASL